MTTENQLNNDELKMKNNIKALIKKNVLTSVTKLDKIVMTQLSVVFLGKFWYSLSKQPVVLLVEVYKIFLLLLISVKQVSAVFISLLSIDRGFLPRLLFEII